MGVTPDPMGIPPEYGVLGRMQDARVVREVMELRRISWWWDAPPGNGNGAGKHPKRKRARLK